MTNGPDAGARKFQSGIQALGREPASRILADARKAGLRGVEVDLSASIDRRAVLVEIGRSLAFPPHYGANFDALQDCLTDLPLQHRAAHEAHGLCLLLRHLPPPPRLPAEDRATLTEVFADAAAKLAEAGFMLSVFL